MNLQQMATKLKLSNHKFRTQTDRQCSCENKTIQLYCLTGYIHRNSSREGKVIPTSNMLQTDNELRLTTSSVSTVLSQMPTYAVITCEIKPFQNYFSLRRRPTGIILFWHMETCLKLFQKLMAAHDYFPT